MFLSQKHIAESHRNSSLCTPTPPISHASVPAIIHYRLKEDVFVKTLASVARYPSG